MSPGKISEKVVTDRLVWIEEMVVGVRAAYCLRDCMASHPEMVDQTL